MVFVFRLLSCSFFCFSISYRHKYIHIHPQNTACSWNLQFEVHEGHIEIKCKHSTKRVAIDFLLFFFCNGSIKINLHAIRMLVMSVNKNCICNSIQFEKLRCRWLEKRAWYGVASAFPRLKSQLDFHRMSRNIIKKIDGIENVTRIPNNQNN